MPRGRKKKVKLETAFKPELAKSLGALVLIVAAGLSLVSYVAPDYPLNHRIQGYLGDLFGYSSFVFPIILLFCAIMLIDALKFGFKSFKNLFGLVLALIVISSFMQLPYPAEKAYQIAEQGKGGGMLGYSITQALIGTVSIYGAVIILLALALLNVIILTGVTLDSIAHFFVRSFSALSVFSNIKLPAKKPKEDNIEVSESSGYQEEPEPQLVSSFSERESNPFEDDVMPAKAERKEPVIEILPNPSEPSTMENVAIPSSGSPATAATLPYRNNLWETPPLDILVDAPDTPPDSGDTEHRKKVIKDTLKSFGIAAEVVGVKVGPAVTRYSLEAEGGTRIAKISNLSGDLALALASPTGNVRIEAPIPGTSQIGIEVPNHSRSVVNFKDLLLSEPMKAIKSKLAIALGKDVGGVTRVYDLVKMPHLLVAGTTGSGKSVFLHSIIFSILYRASPQEVQFIMVDPKRVELVHYNEIPHLATPVVTDIDKAPAIFRWAVHEMEERYKKFEATRTRNIEAYNEMAGFAALPYIVLIVDELAEIMVADPSSVEKNIIRLGQLARATGIHLILAVQRPSTDIITGLIKANIPARVAFNVMSQVDSRVIIDQPGAEKLLGKGDMLFIPPDMPKPTRIQGAFIRDKEIANLVTYFKSIDIKPEYREDIFQPSLADLAKGGTGHGGNEEIDPLYEAAKAEVLATQKASTSYLQRRLSIGYSRAAKILDQLERTGVIGAQVGNKPREIFNGNAPKVHEPENTQGIRPVGGKESGEIDTGEFYEPEL